MLVAEADQGAGDRDAVEGDTSRNEISQGMDIQLAAGMQTAKISHDDRSRDRFGELMAEDDDQGQGDRGSSGAVSEKP